VYTRGDRRRKLSTRQSLQQLRRRSLRVYAMAIVASTIAIHLWLLELNMFIYKLHCRHNSSFIQCTFYRSVLSTDPCQLFYMHLHGSNVSSILDAYLGQYYELQDDTFSVNSPVYVTRANSSIWLYYSFSEGRWELADRISDVNVVVYAFSSNTADYDVPPAVSDWTFPAENVTISGVTLTCTCK